MSVFNQIVENLKVNNLMAIDNHNCGTQQIKIDAIVLLDNGQLGGLRTGVPQCLNEVYLSDDGRVHLSTKSINGPLYYPNKGLDGYLEDERVRSILHIDMDGQEWTYHK